MLAKSHRFHGLGSLRPVYRQGQTVRSSQISLRYRLNSRRETYRASVVVSRKVHKSAVKRNRIRRRIYEIIRLEETKIIEPHEFIFTVFSDQLLDWPSDRVSREITGLLTKAGISTKK